MQKLDPEVVFTLTVGSWSDRPQVPYSVNNAVLEAVVAVGSAAAKVAHSIEK